MRFISARLLRVFGLMAFVVAALLVASRWLVICGLVTLPITFPAVLVLGGDGLDETYGVWRSRALVWLISLPVMLLLAWIYCRFIRAERASLPLEQGSPEDTEYKPRLCMFSIASFVLGSLPMLGWIMMSVSNPQGIFPFGMSCAGGGVLVSPLPIILAIIARRRIRRSEGALSGTRLAKAGMILPFVPAAIMIPWYMLAM
jgi:hypothetical protein